MDSRRFSPGDPRAQRPKLEPVPWHRDSGVLSATLGIVGFLALLFGILFFDQLYQFVNGVDLEGRYGRCGPDSVGQCATVTQATVISSSGDTLTLDEGGPTVPVRGVSGASAGAFTPGESVETESLGGPIAEVKAHGNMLFTQYYVPENPFYVAWQGAVFGVLALVWTAVYVWAMVRAGYRTPLQVIRRQ